MIKLQLTVQTDGAGLQPLGHPVGIVDILVQMVPAEFVVAVVGQRGGLVLVAERQDGDHRTEDLLAVEPVEVSRLVATVDARSSRRGRAGDHR